MLQHINVPKGLFNHTAVNKHRTIWCKDTFTKDLEIQLSRFMRQITGTKIKIPAEIWMQCHAVIIIQKKLSIVYELNQQANYFVMIHNTLMGNMRPN